MKKGVYKYLIKKTVYDEQDHFKILPCYTPVEDGTYYVITRGGRALQTGEQAGGRASISPRLAMVMKFHG